MKLTQLQTTEERIKFLEKSITHFSEHARTHDEAGTFPFENFATLKSIGYPALTVPKKYGGLGISLVEMLQMQEKIAIQDGSTALAIGWHMGITKNLGETDTWNEAVYKKFAEDVVARGALINNVASEKATGSPTRGGLPETTARKTEDGWILNGRKTFATLAPVLDYISVSATIEGTDKVASFLVSSDLHGVSVDETWDSIAMKSTGSHDLVFDEVMLQKEDLVHYLIPGNKQAQGWLLHIPACYLGIAKAAQQYAVNFAKTYSPNSVKGTIADIPAVQQKLGEIELRVLESSAFLYHIADKWDQADETKRNQLKPELSAVKLAVVNKAVDIVDIAMRVVGARSLSASNPLQRYYRDVRAGIHNPPMDDMTLMQLATHSLNN